MKFAVSRLLAKLDISIRTGLSDRWSMFVDWAKPQRINKMEKIDRALVIRYGEYLQTLVAKNEMLPSIAQGYVLAVNTVMDSATEHGWKNVSPTNDCGIWEASIYCCACGIDVDARLTDGGEIYPYRIDLQNQPFWCCDTCGNFVGCHHKTKAYTTPIGCIPTSEIKYARKIIHALLDRIWQSGRIGRSELYQAISDEVGCEYHTANIRSIEEARTVYRIVHKYS
ncbi:hypothetical protein AADEFJLK_03573 [Methylovulum psychrotolerans]|uniref:Uncharacterized protein n=2 Tax=Methylovulum psychrotolerans TaxID=1704499 RepID=A0A2S5CIQ1_9GAMM|nr:hypothetical protein AADEFJLK_03573 [Methylovulum psychrotolerans]